MSRIDRSVLPLVTGSGVAPLVDGLAAVHVVSDTWRDVLTHLPHRTSRHPQAVPLSFIRDNPRGGTEGRGPSLHVDASASTLRPLSPYGPDQRGLPPFPLFPALRFCCSSGRKGSLVPRIGGQGAWQPSLRSGRLRRPARAVRDSSRRPLMCHWHIATPARLALELPQGLFYACSSDHIISRRPLLGWTGQPSTSQKTQSVPPDGARQSRTADCV